MSGSFPKITMGMTCFNARDTIARAIAGALAQNYENKEIVIVDDASRDGSVEIVRQAIAAIPNARLVVHEKNTGVAGALNTIIANAQGEYLAIFDDDDVSDPDRLSEQLKRIQDYEARYGADMILCHAARTQTYENGMVRYEQTIGTQGGPAPHGQIVAERVLTGNLGGYGRDIVGSCANCSRMGKTENFRRLGGFDAQMRRAEDTDFSVRFALAGGHFVGIARPLVHQTMTGGTEKSIDSEEIAETKLLEKHADFLKKIRWYEFVRAWLAIRYAHYRGQKARMLFLMAKLFLASPVKFIKKIYWSLPASNTRSAYVDWHHGKLAARQDRVAP